MEPIKPEVKERVLREQPQATPEEIEEYEKLLAQRFTSDPDFQPTPAPIPSALLAPDQQGEQRLLELQRKLFPETIQ